MDKLKEIKQDEKKLEKSKENTILNNLKKFWNFVWKSNSIWSWIVSLILAFIIVRFIFFPVLSLTTGTSLPLVVVESSSMHHSGNYLGNLFSTKASFDSWWDQNKLWYEENNISHQQTLDFPLKTGFDKGDIMFVIGDSSPEVGEIIIFEAGQNHPIIHRIVNIREENGKLIYSTKGDNNANQLTKDNNPQKTDEINIKSSQVIGKAIFRIPILGWIKLVFVGIINFFVDIFRSIF